MQMIFMFLFSFLGTVLAVLLGSCLNISKLKINHTIESFLQNFAVGAIIGLTFLEIAREGMENFSLYIDSTLTEGEINFMGALYSLLIVAGSGLIFFFLHEIIHKCSHHHDKDKTDDEPCHDHGHTAEVFTKENRHILMSSFIFLGAISIHNIPEGLALGVSFTNTASNVVPTGGIIFSCSLFIHNFLVGYSMCSSFKKAGKSTLFSTFMTVLSALPAYVFAICGFFINTLNLDATSMKLLNGIIFSISTGSLLYVLIVELLPQIFYQYKHRFTFIFVLAGLIVSCLLIYLA